MPKIGTDVEEVPAERNREAWLTELGRMLEPSFSGMKIKPYRVTCGWPCRGGLSIRKRVIGECHGVQSSKASLHELFISPFLEEPSDVGGTLAHEIAHIAAGIEAKHGRVFVKVCNHAGLTKGKPTSRAPGPELNSKILRFCEKLGKYPHSALDPVRIANPKPKDITLSCAHCQCKVRISLRWLEKSGYPVCGCGGAMIYKGQDSEDGGEE